MQGEAAKLSLFLSPLYGSKAGRGAGGCGVLRQAGTAASLPLPGLRLPRDGHGGDDGRRSELSRAVVEQRCVVRHEDGRLAGVAFRRDGRRRVPEQREEDPQGARPDSQQVRWELDSALPALHCIYAGVSSPCPAAREENTCRCSPSLGFGNVLCCLQACREDDDRAAPERLASRRPAGGGGGGGGNRSYHCRCSSSCSPALHQQQQQLI